MVGNRRVGIPVLTGGLLFLTALAWVGVWRQLEDSPLTRVPMVDERYYLDRALEISRGQLGPEGPIYMSPLYPFLIWISGSARDLDAHGVLAGRPPLGIRVLQAALWLATAWLLWRTARRFLPARWSWLPPVLFVLYRPPAALVNALLLEVPYTFCVVALLALLSTEQRPVC